MFDCSRNSVLTTQASDLVPDPDVDVYGLDRRIESEEHYTVPYVLVQTRGSM